MSTPDPQMAGAPPDFRSRFHQRLLGRMLIYAIGPTALVLVLLIAFGTRRDVKAMREAREEFLRSQAALAAQKIDDENRNAVLSAQRMAEAQVAGMFGDRRASLEYARLVLEHSPEFTGAYFGYEPDADGKDAESLGTLPAKSMDATGRFIPYWFINPEMGKRIALEPLVDMETSLYYQGAKEAFANTRRAACTITEPYVYHGKMIVEQVYPIIIDGQFKGVAGVDRALTDLERELRRLDAELDADLFLISARRKFIAATTDAQHDSPGETGTKGLLKTQAVAGTPYAELFGRLVDKESELLLELEPDPTDGQRSYYAVAEIDTGGWTLILRKSEAAILAPVWAKLREWTALALAALVIVVTAMIAMAVRLSRRVNVAAQAAGHVARGDLSRVVDPGRSRDETGLLLMAIRKMTENLNNLVGNVKKASIQLHSTATELTATSREQEATVGSFGASANQIAAAVKQISATSNELVQTMNEVNQVAAETAELATTGRAGLQEMESTMRDLDEATCSIADKLAVINEKASNITGVVSTINKVAEQTNLLSVNAAIEAEKAGEYGVGFLVVAREIRRLADQTAGATSDIEQMVREMESAVSTGVMEMDRFSDKVRRSVNNVAGISQQMGGIIQQVNGNTASFERVAEGMRSQSEGADQISEAMGRLTTNAARTCEAACEYAQAAAELQNAIGSLKSSIASFELKA